MVFAAITGTPCIVFNCNNHKIKGTYDWISYLDYIRFAETLEDAKTCIPDLLAMKNCTFDDRPLQPYFFELSEYIRNMIVNGK
jgi:pyruvyl transferase EpsI